METEKAIELPIDIKFMGNLLVDGFWAYANVLSLQVNSIDVAFESIGFTDTDALKLAINSTSKSICFYVNHYFEQWYKFPIPQDIFGIFMLSDIFLRYADGYLFAGATPTFLGPSYAQPALAQEGNPLKLDQF